MTATSAAVQTIVDNGNRLFSEKTPLLSHWQELAEHFYYDRADFTSPLNIGSDYAAGSFSSRASIYRRDMADLYRTMLRPSDFFEVKSLDDARNKVPDARAWLEYATTMQRAVMYRNGAGFTRATEAGDHDHLTFGQAVIECAATSDRRNVFYRNWHLRDCAWSEDYAGSVSDVHRNCKPTITQLMQLFPGKVPEALTRDAEKDPYKKISARHVVVPAASYDTGISVRADQEFISLWVLPDCEGEVLENIGRTFRGYIVPRGPTVSGSQYARSVFTSIILPDSRTQQAIERILLEAGEKAIDPPMIAAMDVIRSDIGLGAGGITWLDKEYDERLGEALRPLALDFSGLPAGQNMSDRLDQTIRMGFMTDKVQIPDTSGMTAYQIRKVVEQQMRAHIPMFEPVEVEYSEPLCSETFKVMRSLGAFPANEIPDSLKGSGVEFSFKSPIKDLEDEGMQQKLIEGLGVVKEAAALDPMVAKLPNAMAIAKDLLRRTGWPEEWLNDDKKLAAAAEQMAAAAQEQTAAQTVGGAAEAAGKAAPMVKALQQAA
ncbi:head-tail connector protein [Mesorhizobium sp. BR1-1-3]|uniref:portal protein n=1 Tax=Mesorhizobium sp. BR1-1-3 TaxID=2876651 RepID=UPI001CD0CFEB|nr:portal protein [Mesorhizobium sp. BR1-1-3]MBZ9888952.1 head-tail connector protein [Mesorhizobium sp. BR1-1-3]